jgi:hypothetical protein
MGRGLRFWCFCLTNGKGGPGEGERKNLLLRGEFSFFLVLLSGYVGTKRMRALSAEGR